jgi:hypothetical protein
MNRATQKSLGGFEERLLRKLREVVADGTVSQPVRRGRALTVGGWVKRPWLVAGATGLAAAVALLLLVGSPFGGKEDGRAWAVTSIDGGTVKVEIDSLSDADGLQRELRQAGVPTVVQYIPPGKTCAGQGSSHASVTSPESHSAGDHAHASEHPRGGRRTVQIATMADGGIEFTFDAAAHPGETLVIRSQGLAPGQPPAAHPAAVNAGSAISVSHAPGDARPCRLVDSTTR